MKTFVLFMSFILVQISWGKSTVSRVVYYNNLFGHIHKNPSRYSQSLSTIGCGHPIKILKVENKEMLSQDFYKVQVGPYTGFISEKYLSDKKPGCFQDRFPRFFDNLELSLTDMYYWGKLYDQYIYGRSTVQ